MNKHLSSVWLVFCSQMAGSPCWAKRETSQKLLLQAQQYLQLLIKTETGLFPTLLLTQLIWPLHCYGNRWLTFSLRESGAITPHCVCHQQQHSRKICRSPASYTPSHQLHTVTPATHRHTSYTPSHQLHTITQNSLLMHTNP